MRWHNHEEVCDHRFAAGCLRMQAREVAVVRVLTLSGWKTIWIRNNKSVLRTCTLHSWAKNATATATTEKLESASARLNKWTEFSVSLGFTWWKRMRHANAFLRTSELQGKIAYVSNANVSIILNRRTSFSNFEWEKRRCCSGRRMGTYSGMAFVVIAVRAVHTVGTWDDAIPWNSTITNRPSSETEVCRKSTFCRLQTIKSCRSRDGFVRSEQKRYPEKNCD